MSLLSPGDAFPTITVTPVDAGPFDIPDAFTSNFAVVFFYRGAWCPYCRTQLRAFQHAQDTFAELNIKLAVLSVDDEATTRALIDKHALTFPVGHGADPDAIAAATGAFVNPEPRYLQSTGFVLDPAGNVLVSVYSSGAIGRLVPDDVIGMIRYMTEHQAA